MDGRSKTGETEAGKTEIEKSKKETNKIETNEVEKEAMETKETGIMEPGKTENKSADRSSRTLLELSIGIAAWGLLCQIAGVWFVPDKTGYSLGLWLGTLLAVAAGVHMWWALDRALDFERDTAVKMMTKHNIIRYVAIVLAMGLIMVSGSANPLTAFLGLMGLKVAAYLQPFTHKVLGYINN